MLSYKIIFIRKIILNVRNIASFVYLFKKVCVIDILNLKVKSKFCVIVQFHETHIDTHLKTSHQGALPGRDDEGQ